MSRSIAGARIRATRRARGITQAGLARRLDISASYLNLIESGKRTIAGRLLARAAEELGVDVEALDGAAERRLVDQLQDVAADPRLARFGADPEEAGDITGRYPAWARLVAALARSERELGAANRLMSDRLTHDPVLGEAVHRMLTHTAALRSVAEILRDVPDIEDEERRRFIGIMADESRTLSDVGLGLAGHFDRAHEAAITVTPTDEVEALFAARENRFAEIEEALAGAPRDADPRAQAAGAIEAVILGAEDLAGTAARERARSRLGRYADDAHALPLGPLGETAREARYDAEVIAARLGVDTGTVFRRLPSLPVTGSAPRFGYVETNAAGVMTDFLSLPGLAPPRFGAACPLWVNFRAPAEPGRTLRQLAMFPTGLNFVFVARARRLAAPGFGQTGPHMTDMLAMREESAAATVYAPGPETRPEPVGRSCALCPRERCAHRVADHLLV